jgi:hypothetical protein
MFVDMVRKQGAQPAAPVVEAVPDSVAKLTTRPADLPVYGKEFMTSG